MNRCHLHLLLLLGAATALPALGHPTVSSCPAPSLQIQGARGVRLEAQLDLFDPTVFFRPDCHAYVAASGAEYGIVSGASGLFFVDLSTPSAPVQVAFEPLVQQARNVQTFRDKLYVGGDPIRIFDLSQLDAGAVSLVGSIPRQSEQITVDVVSGFLYTEGVAEIFDLNVSSIQPALVNSNGLSAHGKATVVTYTAGPHAGRQIAYVRSIIGGLLVVADVTDKQSISVLAAR